MLRRVPGGQWIAAVLAMICFTPVVINGMFPDGTPRLDLAIGFGIIVIFVLICQRAGLLAAIAALFTHFILLRAPMTIDLSSWHAAYGWWRVGVVVALGVAACYVAAESGMLSPKLPRLPKSPELGRARKPELCSDRNQFWQFWWRIATLPLPDLDADRRALRPNDSRSRFARNRS